jgi:hypothetical protein
MKILLMFSFVRLSILTSHSFAGKLMDKVPTCMQSALGPILLMSDDVDRSNSTVCQSAPFVGVALRTAPLFRPWELKIYSRSWVASRR